LVVVALAIQPNGTPLASSSTTISVAAYVVPLSHSPW
jgi:hypothetical protein